MPTAKALKMAEVAGLDLVEVAPNARPPVCRILDYGKFKYEQKKKARGKPKSHSSVLKEIRVRPKIDVHDVEIKVRKAREFLDAGHKVQVTCLFRGREMAYQNLGRAVLMRVVELLEDIARLDRDPRMEGRRMNLLLTRRPGYVPKAKPVEDRVVEDRAEDHHLDPDTGLEVGLGIPPLDTAEDHPPEDEPTEGDTPEGDPEVLSTDEAEEPAEASEVVEKREEGSEA